MHRIEDILRQLNTVASEIQPELAAHLQWIQERLDQQQRMDSRHAGALARPHSVGDRSEARDDARDDEIVKSVQAVESVKAVSVGVGVAQFGASASTVAVVEETGTIESQTRRASSPPRRDASSADRVNAASSTNTWGQASGTKIAERKKATSPTDAERTGQTTKQNLSTDVAPQASNPPRRAPAPAINYSHSIIVAAPNFEVEHDEEPAAFTGSRSDVAVDAGTPPHFKLRVTAREEEDSSLVDALRASAAPVATPPDRDSEPLGANPEHPPIEHPPVDQSSGERSLVDTSVARVKEAGGTSPGQVKSEPNPVPGTGRLADRRQDRSHRMPPAPQDPAFRSPESRGTVGHSGVGSIQQPLPSRTDENGEQGFFLSDTKSTTLPLAGPETLKLGGIPDRAIDDEHLPLFESLWFRQAAPTPHIARIVDRLLTKVCPTVPAVLHFCSDVQSSAPSAMICTQIAWELSRRGYGPALLVDADFTHREISRQLGNVYLSGLSECLHAGDPIETWVRPTGIEHLSWLSSGAGDVSFRRIAGGRWAEISVQLRRRFQWICVHAGAAQDRVTSTWGRFCDFSYLISNMDDELGLSTRQVVDYMRKVECRLSGLITID
jgi:hypothetical protein